MGPCPYCENRVMLEVERWKSWVICPECHFIILKKHLNKKIAMERATQYLLDLLYLIKIKSPGLDVRDRLALASKVLVPRMVIELL